MDFENYALDSAAKIEPGKLAEVIQNRRKLWMKAFRPYSSLLEGAGRILDFGCGSGELLEFLASHYRAEVCGFDVSRTQLELAGRRLSKTAVTLVSDPARIDGKFDLIFSMHVIEHVADDQLHDHVGKMSELLAPGGSIILATPNGMNPFAYAFYMSTDRTHLRMHSPLSLNEVFRPFGLEVVSIHRESPQAYDLMSGLKFLVWWIYGQFFKLGVYATAPGIRGIKLPLIMSSTFLARICRQQECSRAV